MLDITVFVMNYNYLISILNRHLDFLRGELANTASLSRNVTLRDVQISVSLGIYWYDYLFLGCLCLRKM